MVDQRVGQALVEEANDNKKKIYFIESKSDPTTNLSYRCLNLWTSFTVRFSVYLLRNSVFVESRPEEAKSFLYRWGDIVVDVDISGFEMRREQRGDGEDGQRDEDADQEVGEAREAEDQRHAQAEELEKTPAEIKRGRLIRYIGSIPLWCYLKMVDSVLEQWISVYPLIDKGTQ